VSPFVSGVRPIRAAFATTKDFAMNQYLLLLHETPADYADMSPADMQELIGRYVAWTQEMRTKGHLVAGEKLADDGGRQIRVAHGKPLASDGPYAEAKDVVGGLYILKAESDAHAEQLAATCPHLRGRNWIQLRRIDAMN
jgi:hypothetical protein